MDIYKFNWTSLQNNIFSLLCIKAGDKLTQREIAKHLNVSPTAVANSLKLLEKNNFIKVEKNRSMNLVSLNRDKRETIELKRVENLKNIYLSGLAKFLEKEFTGATIVIFGSYSMGEDIASSDIDIAIIERKNKQLNFEKFEAILNREINIQTYPSWKQIHKNLKNNILNGIILNGSVNL